MGEHAGAGSWPATISAAVPRLLLMLPGIKRHRRDKDVRLWWLVEVGLNERDLLRLRSEEDLRRLLLLV